MNVRVCFHGGSATKAKHFLCFHGGFSQTFFVIVQAFLHLKFNEIYVMSQNVKVQYTYD